MTLFQDSSKNLVIMISFIMFYAYHLNSFTYLKKKFPFDMFSTTQLKAPRRQENISKGLLKGTKQIYKLDVTASVLKFQNHLDIFVPPPPTLTHLIAARN